MSETTIPETVKELVRELDPIVGYDIYLCDCGDTKDCPPELIEVNLSALYIDYGMDHDAVAESPYGEEVLRLWEAVDRLAAAPQVVDVVQFELVAPMRGQGALWEPEAWEPALPEGVAGGRGPLEEIPHD